MNARAEALTLTDESPAPPAKQAYLTVWSRSRYGEWLIERSYYEQYVRNALKIPPGDGRVGDDGRYYIALPQGVMPSTAVIHPAMRSVVDAYTQEPVFPLTRVIA